MALLITDCTTTSANWIPDVNRFNIPKPPAWFLKALWDQDAALVILPSRKTKKYLLARRRELSMRVPVIVDHLAAQHKGVKYSDADLLASLKLVHVDSISGDVHNGRWNPALIHELKQRDMWSAGGAQHYIDTLEAGEKKIADKKRADLLEDIDHRARDAYRSLQARTGQRNQHANDRAGHAGRTTLIKSGSLNSGSIAGSGRVTLGV